MRGTLIRGSQRSIVHRTVFLVEFIKPLAYLVNWTLLFVDLPRRLRLIGVHFQVLLVARFLDRMPHDRL